MGLTASQDEKLAQWMKQAQEGGQEAYHSLSVETASVLRKFFNEMGFVRRVLALLILASAEVPGLQGLDSFS